MSKSEIEIKDMSFEDFVCESIKFWLMVIFSPAIIYSLTNFFAGDPIWIGWRWTIAIYVICLVLYIPIYYQFRKYQAALGAETNK